MKYKISIIGKEGPNFIEYERISDTIFAISRMPIDRDDMRKLEQTVGLDSNLGVVHVQYQQKFYTGQCIKIWSVTELADCDWE